jgi:hypothetical protein
MAFFANPVVQVIALHRIAIPEEEVNPVPHVSAVQLTQLPTPKPFATVACPF